MASYYVRSSAAGAGDGLSWANAFTTLAAALAACAAGDALWVADDHAESQSSSMTLASPGTAVAPVKIICVNTHTSEPPTAKAESATVSTTGNTSISMTGFAYVYGVTFQCATGNANSAALGIGGTTTSFGWTFEACTLGVGSTNSSARVRLGNLINTNQRDGYVKLIRTKVQFGAPGQFIQLGNARINWQDTPAAVNGTVPTKLFVASSAFDLEVVGVDLSALGSAESIIDASGAVVGRARFHRCKLGAVITGTIVGPGGVIVDLESCGGDTDYREEHYRYQGSILHETTIVRAGGASDGTTPFSHRMVTLASGPSLFAPLEGPWITRWVDQAGQKTVTLHILHDSEAPLQDDECWIEVFYAGDGSSPLGYTHSRVADVFAPPSPHDDSQEEWTTTGMSSPYKQKLSATVEIQRAGLVWARALVAKPNYTVYVCPKLEVM